MVKDEHSVEEVKKAYSEIQQKFDLPGFDEFNKDFSIEKADTETDFFIREIRKMVGERLSNYLRFVETLIHPINAPVFVFSLVKSASEEDKKMLTNIYKVLAKNELAFIECDIEFNEQKEVEFIKNSYKRWQEIKKNLLSFVGEVKEDWDKELDLNHESRKYFG